MLYPTIEIRVSFFLCLKNTFSLSDIMKALSNPIVWFDISTQHYIISARLTKSIQK